MSEVEHSLAALLREGATPTADEMQDLSAIGRFVSAMVARLTSGTSRGISGEFSVGRGLAGMDRFERSSPILSAATADRWLEAMGSGAAMLEPRLSRPAAVDVDPFAWSRLVQDAVEELPIVRLIEDQAAGRGAATQRGARPVSRSLFGPQTSRDPIQFAAYGKGEEITESQAGVGQPPQGPEHAAPVTLADGSRLDPAVISALVASGLSLAATPTSDPSMLRLDGLGVNDRTPALASALRHATGAGRPGASPRELASRASVGTPERMGARVVAALQPRDLAESPQVQLAGAYDSAAGDFLHVLPRMAPQMAPPGVSRDGGSRPIPGVSLDAIVPPNPTRLRPFSGGVFPSEPREQKSALVAAHHTPSGWAVPGTERGPIGPPLLRVREATSAPGDASVQGPGPAASPASLSSLSRHEQMAMRVLGGRDAGRAVSERFSPVVATTGSPRAPGGLEEVAWISMTGPREISAGSLESLPVGRALPLSAGREVERPTDPRAPTHAALDVVKTAEPARQETDSDVRPSPLAPRGRAPSTLSDEPTALLRRASRARKALGRTTLTAREIQEVAPFLASLLGETRPGEHPSLMPSLAHGVAQRTERFQGLESVGHLDTSIGERLLARITNRSESLAPGLAESLMEAGWSGAELEMLQLASGPTAEVESQDRATGTRPAEPGLIRQDRATGSRPAQPGLMRQVARLLTSAESLSGSEHFPGLDETPAGRQSRLGYFEGIAPPSLHESGRLSLSEAIGELLALAESAGTPTHSATSAVLGRLQGASRLLSPRASKIADQAISEPTLVQPREAGSLSRRVAAAASRVRRGPAGLGRFTQRERAVTREVGLDMSLGSSLAPELMLPGLADPAAFVQGQGLGGTLDWVRLEGGQGAEAHRGPDGRLAGQAPQAPQAPMGITSFRPRAGARARTVAPVGGFFPELLHGVARGQQAAGPVTGRQRELTSFGNAWLSRVDGARTGLELGIDPERTPFSAAFGAEPEGTRTALTDDLHLVNTGATVDGPAASPRTVQAARSERTGGGRRRSAAAQGGRSKSASLRHVDVGGRGAGPRRDVDQMAARVRGTSMGGERSSMPLIANSMQAVAQSAMRSATTERAPGDRVHEERVTSATRGADSEGEATSQENTLSKEAFEALAQQMADRVARELKRERERRGQWT